MCLFAHSSLCQYIPPFSHYLYFFKRNLISRIVLEATGKLLRWHRESLGQAPFPWSWRSRGLVRVSACRPHWVLSSKVHGVFRLPQCLPNVPGPCPDDPALVLSAVTASQTWPASREMGQVFCSRPYSLTGLSVWASDLGSCFGGRPPGMAPFPSCFTVLREGCFLQRQAPRLRSPRAPVLSVSPVHVGCGLRVDVGDLLSLLRLSGASCPCGLVPVITSGKFPAVVASNSPPARSPVSSWAQGHTCCAAGLSCG